MDLTTVNLFLKKYLLPILCVGIVLLLVVYMNGSNPVKTVADDRVKQIPHLRLNNQDNKPYREANHDHTFTSEEIHKFRNGFSVQDDEGLISYIKQQWLEEPSQKALQIDMSKKADHSQYGQSIDLDEILQHKQNGFFVECGAADGEGLSNSLYFELERGWTGLLVEANPDLYKRLVTKNRHAFSSNTCLSTQNATGIFKFHPANYVGALDGEMDKMHEKYLKEKTNFENEIEVQCFTLYSLMLAVGVTKIDLFTLDIEGPELSVLKTIPFEKLYIDVISVEYLSWGGNKDNERTAERLAAFREFFKQTGLYEEVGTLPARKTEDRGIDIVFKRKK